MPAVRSHRRIPDPSRNVLELRRRLPESGEVARITTLLFHNVWRVHSDGRRCRPAVESPPETALDTARHQLTQAASHVDADPNIVEAAHLPRRGPRGDRPAETRRRHRRDVTGVPRPARQRPRPLQGRAPLSPARQPRGVHRPGDVDDLEVRRRRHPLRRCEGGVVVNPKELSDDEMERLTRRFTNELRNVIGPMTDIPAPDMGTDAQTMAWIMDAYSVQEAETIPGVVTGKPPVIGGSKGREEAPGRSVAIISREAAGVLRLPHPRHDRRRPGLRQRRRQRCAPARRLGRHCRRRQRRQRRRLRPRRSRHPRHPVPRRGTGGRHDVRRRDHRQRGDTGTRRRPPGPGRYRERHHRGQRPGRPGRHGRRGANGPTTFVADSILTEREIPVVPDIPWPTRAA